MSGQRRALVIGGSVGGLFAAHMLRSIGWDVVVFERSGDDLARRGAGIGANDGLFAVMRRIGVPFDASNAIALPSRVWLETNGNIAAEVPTSGFATAWAHVYQALRDALPGECCCFDRTLVHVEERADDVTAIFADGSSASGSLLIAADGMHSTVRQQLLPKVVPRYAGYVAWRGVLEEADTPPAVIQSRLFDRQTFCFPEGELFLAMPNPGVDQDITPGRRRYYFIWYRPVDYESTLSDLCTDVTGRQHGVAIPPPLIRPEFIRGLRASAVFLLAPQMAAVVTQAKQPLLQAIFDLESSQLTFGRVALLGDAAFVARPHVVAGVTKAALDAQGLADALADCAGDLAAGLARYESVRRAFGSSIVAHARYLGAHLQPETSGHAPPAPRPDLILRDYGAPHLLRDPVPANRM